MCTVIGVGPVVARADCPAVPSPIPLVIAIRSTVLGVRRYIYIADPALCETGPTCVACVQLYTILRDGVVCTVLYGVWRLRLRRDTERVCRRVTIRVPL